MRPYDCAPSTLRSGAMERQESACAPTERKCCQVSEIFADSAQSSSAIRARRSGGMREMMAVRQIEAIGRRWASSTGTPIAHMVG